MEETYRYMKKVLMITYQYPPYQGSGALQRILKFSAYLPDMGWQPIILTVWPQAYENISGDQLCEIPKDVIVKRTFALDAARHLAINRRYLLFTALPDRWVSWWFSAVPVGLFLIRKYKPDIIWSTYYIPTAHLIGLTLHHFTGIPWVADFRDPMTEKGYPYDPTIRKIYRWIERHTIKQCSRAVFTAPGTLNVYAERYPDMPKSHWAMIANGYDEEDFIRAEQDLVKKKPLDNRTILVHSGALYQKERDPTLFFVILSELYKTGKISPSDLKIVLRAPTYETYYRKKIQETGIEKIVFIEPLVSHQEAIKEMLNADGLLLFWSHDMCNYQIPAKTYEYLRARRPIFSMLDSEGDTAKLLKKIGINTIVPPDSKEEIREGFLNFLSQVRKGHMPALNDDEIKKYTRKMGTMELAKILEAAQF